MSSLRKELVGFSRVITLLFNRATIYHSSHPYVQQTIDSFHSAIEEILKSISPLVFIMNHDQFFLDEEPLHAGTNVSRIVAYFSKTGIQSISFENGITKSEVKSFLDVFTSLDAYPDADAMKKGLVVQGVKHVRINHVFFRKVTQDDAVISQETLKELTPKIAGEDERKTKKMFVDLALEHLLAEELTETITIENLLKDPAALSEKMTETDLASAASAGSGGMGPGGGGGRAGLVLMHQIEVLGEDLKKNLLENTGTNLPEIAGALFEMKKRLMQGIEAQKALDIDYPDEELILDKVNEIADNVVLRIVKDEYKGGKTSATRLAQIVRRLVPEAAELKRLLPKIRSALMEDGMALAEYLQLVTELGKELQSEELASILHESSEAIGIDGEVLIQEIKQNPGQAAELIYLAAEIRKGSGDEQVLSDLLVDYVERLGSKLTSDIGTDGKAEGEQHLRQILTSIESGIVGRLKGMNYKDDLLERLEVRFNDRIDGILEKVKLDWIQSRSGGVKKAQTALSVLELLEQTVVEGDELDEIFKVIRDKVQAGEIDKDNFTQIYAEITRQQASRAREMKERMPPGIMEASVLTSLIEKEIARAKRYQLPFSALSFSLVKAVQKSTGPTDKLSYPRVSAAVFQAISKVVRDADIIGELGKNRMVVLLPMTSGSQAQLALKRCLKLLHINPVNVDGITVEIRLAGVATVYDFLHTPDAGSFVRTLTNDLAQMERRMKNLQAYF